MIRFFMVALVTLLLGACSSLKVVDVDPNTGYFPATTKAAVVVNKPIDLDSRKGLLLIPDVEFERGQITNIKYFDEVMMATDLEKKIVQNNLGDKVPSIRDLIGVNNAAKHFKTFLWFHHETIGVRPNQQARFILTDPLTMEDLFITETKLDYVWAGVNDQNNWYPMFNSLIDYIKEHSRTYRK